MIQEGNHVSRDEAHYTFTVEVKEDPLDGGYVARCKELPGCYSQGESEEEALDNIVDAIAGVLTVKMRAEIEAKSARFVRRENKPTQERRRPRRVSLAV